MVGDTANITGVITATAFHTGAEGSAIRVTSDTISGPSEIVLDPAGVGDDTGAVRVKGDLFVDGTQFIVNSTAIELADFNVGIATTVGSAETLDGAGIGIGSANIRKTFVYDFSSDSLKSSENLDLASGKVYKINETEVLSSRQLSIADINATGVSTFANAEVTGIATIATLETVTGTITNLTSTSLETTNSKVTGIATIATGTVTNLTSTSLETTNAKITGITTVSNTTENTLGDSNTGALLIDGGVGIDKNLTIGGNLNVQGYSEFVGVATFRGGTINLGDADTDDINVAGEFVSNLIPNQTDAYDLGNGDKKWRSLNVSGFTTAGGLRVLGSAQVGSLTVDSDVNVAGNVTIGGTTLTVSAQTLNISDPDIILGVTTASNGDDIATDITANHGGIAIASTEGYPLVDLVVAGLEELPTTYKKFMWFGSDGDSFTGLGTDAWLSNYAIGIGSTQFPTGTRFAAGNVQITQEDLSVVRNINASGVGTFGGALYVAGLEITGGASIGVDVRTRNLNVSGITTIGDSIADTVTIVGDTDFTGSVDAVNINSTGIITATSFVGDGSGLTGVASTDNIQTATPARFLDNVSISGIATVSTELNVGTAVTIADYGAHITGVVTATTFVGALTGNADTATSATTATTATNVTVADESSDTTCFPLFVTDATGDLAPKSGTNLTFKADSGELTASSVVVGSAVSAASVKTPTIAHSNGTTAATIDSSGNFVAAQNLTVTGNLFVNGSTTQVNSSSMTIEDRTIELGQVDGSAPSSATTWDLGVLFNYNSSGAKKSGVIWEHADARFKFGSQVTDGGGTDNDSPQVTVSNYAAIEVGSIWINDCAGQSQLVDCSGGVRTLQNITIDGGSF